VGREPFVVRLGSVRVGGSFRRLRVRFRGRAASGKKPGGPEVDGAAALARPIRVRVRTAVREAVRVPVRLIAVTCPAHFPCDGALGRRCAGCINFRDPGTRERGCAVGVSRLYERHQPPLSPRFSLRACHCLSESLPLEPIPVRFAFRSISTAVEGAATFSASPYPFEAPMCRAPPLECQLPPSTNPKCTIVLSWTKCVATVSCIMLFIGRQYNAKVQLCNPGSCPNGLARNSDAQSSASSFIKKKKRKKRESFLKPTGA
jgi:hypothetical protein